MSMQRVRFIVMAVVLSLATGAGCSPGGGVPWTDAPAAPLPEVQRAMDIVADESPEIRDAVGLIVLTGQRQGRANYAMGKPSVAYRSWQRLLRTGRFELFERLAAADSAALRAYSLQAMAYLDYERALPILRRHLTDPSSVEYIEGCFGGSPSVALFAWRALLRLDHQETSTDEAWAWLHWAASHRFRAAPLYDSRLTVGEPCATPIQWADDKEVAALAAARTATPPVDLDTVLTECFNEVVEFLILYDRGERCVPLLEHSAADRSRPFSYHALETLSLTRHRRYEPLFRKMLTSENEEERDDGKWCLARIGICVDDGAANFLMTSPKTVARGAREAAALEAKLRAAPQGNRTKILAEALHRDDTSADLFAEDSEDEWFEYPRGFLFNLARRYPELIPQVIRYGTGGDAEATALSIEAIRRHGVQDFFDVGLQYRDYLPPDIVETLRRRARADDATALNCMQTLASCDDPAVFALAAERLRSDDDTVASYAAESLRLLAGPAAVAELGRAVDRQRQRVAENPEDDGAAKRLDHFRQQFGWAAWNLDQCRLVRDLLMRGFAPELRTKEYWK